MDFRDSLKFISWQNYDVMPIYPITVALKSVMEEMLIHA